MKIETFPLQKDISIFFNSRKKIKEDNEIKILVFILTHSSRPHLSNPLFILLSSESKIIIIIIMLLHCLAADY